MTDQAFLYFVIACLVAAVLYLAQKPKHTRSRSRVEPAFEPPPIDLFSTMFGHGPLPRSSVKSGFCLDSKIMTRDDIQITKNRFAEHLQKFIDDVEYDKKEDRGTHRIFNVTTDSMVVD